MSDIVDVIEESEENPLEDCPLVILLKDREDEDGTEVSLNTLDSNELYYFRFKGFGGSFTCNYNLPINRKKIREEIEKFGTNKRYYAAPIKRGKY